MLWLGFGVRKSRKRPFGCSALVRSEPGQRAYAAAILSGVPFGLLQGRKEPFGQPDAVAQPGQVEALDAAVRDARHAERVGPRHALVDEQAEQVLRVARLIAMVCEMDPAGVAARARARVRRAARAAESARRVVDHRVALLRVEEVAVARLGVAVASKARLIAAVAVHHHDRRERAVAARRQCHVHVEWDSVEARHALGVDRGRAEHHAVLGRARVAERVGRRRVGGGREETRDRKGQGNGESVAHQEAGVFFLAVPGVPSFLLPFERALALPALRAAANSSSSDSWRWSAKASRSGMAS